jgi:hypothetical protein
MKLLTVLFVLLVTACGQRVDPVADPIVVVYGSEELKELTEEYIARATAAGIFVAKDEMTKIVFDSFTGKEEFAAGMCYYTEPRKRGMSRVVISKDIWPKLDQCDRKLLVFHELGHCLSHLDHTEKNSELLMDPYFTPRRKIATRNCEIVDNFFKKPDQQQNPSSLLDDESEGGIEL